MDQDDMDQDDILNLATSKIKTLALRMLYLTLIIRNSNMMMLFLEKSISVSPAFHTLQLIVSKFDDVKPCKEAISTSKQLVVRFNKSVKATEMLVKLSEKKLTGDCPTRWSSIYLLLKRLIAV